MSLFGSGVLAMSVGEFDGLSGSLSEEIEFCSSCFSASNRLDINDIRRMKREDSLYALVTHNPADGEGFVNAAAPACDYSAGKYLDAFFVGFFDSAAHIYRIAHFKMGYVFLQHFAFDAVQYFCFHFCHFLLSI